MLVDEVLLHNNRMPAYAGSADGGDVKTLTRDFYIDIEMNGGVYCLCICSGFPFDGASIPRWLWRVCGHPFTSPRDAAAVVHDWLYCVKIFDRATADQIYRDIQILLGISKFKAYTEYYALKLFGWIAWNNHDERDREMALKLGYCTKYIKHKGDSE